MADLVQFFLTQSKIIMGKWEPFQIIIIIFFSTRKFLVFSLGPSSPSRKKGEVSYKNGWMKCYAAI